MSRTTESRAPAAAPRAYGGAPRTVSVALGLVAAGWIALAAALAARGPGDYPWRDLWLYLAIVVGTSIAVIVRGFTGRRDAAWILLGTAMALSAVGDVTYVLLPDDATDAVALWAQAPYLAYYPVAFLGVVTWIRRNATQIPREVWWDGAVLTVAVGTFLGAVFLAPLADAPTAESLWRVVETAYPLGDTLLILLAAFGIALTEGRSGRTLVWIVGAMAAAGLADLVYWRLAQSGSYVEGTILDAVWPLSNLLLVAGAWLQPTSHRRLPLSTRGVLIAPGLSLAVAAATLVYGTTTAIPTVTVVLACGALVGVLSRLNVTVRQTYQMIEARREAATDDLTGLRNRRGFVSLAEDLLADPGVDGAALLVADLDGFKEVNDSLGHIAGDEVLKELARRVINASQPHASTVSRLGGDEFALLALGCDARTAEALAKAIASAVSEPVATGGTRVSMTASIGIALSPTHGTGLSDLLRRADIAMYRAKVEKSGVAVFDPQCDMEGEDRLHRVEELRDGIERGELVLHYQPKLSLASGAVAGVEALVRWQRPHGELTMPNGFLPLARTAGLLPALTDAVLAEAAAQSAKWRAQGLELTIAINLPASALMDEGLPRRVEQLLDALRLPRGALQVEITEEALLRDADRARAVLADLRARGVGIALDDYGTGYSSLLYLREFVVDELKIDQSFVAPMVGDPRARAIVRSTIELAHVLGLTVVAEGIESPEIAVMLDDFGCDVAQGYLWSRPVPPAELVAWLEARRSARIR